MTMSKCTSIASKSISLDLRFIFSSRNSCKNGRSLTQSGHGCKNFARNWIFEPLPFNIFLCLCSNTHTNHNHNNQTEERVPPTEKAFQGRVHLKMDIKEMNPDNIATGKAHRKNRHRQKLIQTNTKHNPTYMHYNIDELVECQMQLGIPFRELPQKASEKVLTSIRFP